MNYLINHPKLSQFIVLIGAFFFLCYFITPSETNILWRFPPLIAQLPIIITESVDFLMFEFMPIEVFDPEIEEFEQKPLFKEITRAIARGILFSIDLIREILLGGVKTIVTFSSWDFVSENKWAYWPALPWTVVSAISVVLGYALKGPSLAMLACFSTVYIAIFGQWEPAMETLSFVLVAAPISFLLGLTLGVLGYQNKAIETALNPILNIAQTMPHFSYLVPVMVFFWSWGSCGCNCYNNFCNPSNGTSNDIGIKESTH